MNRRKGATAALAAKIDLEWITIAHLGKNAMGRTYTEDHMDVLARDIVPGMHVVEWHHQEPPSLDELYGVVTHARRAGDEYQVKVRWVKKPTEKSWLSIHGSMQPHNGRLDGSAGFTLDEVFHLESCSAGSNFQRATAI